MKFQNSISVSFRAVTQDYDLTQDDVTINRLQNTGHDDLELVQVNISRDVIAAHFTIAAQTSVKYKAAIAALMDIITDIDSTNDDAQLGDIHSSYKDLRG